MSEKPKPPQEVVRPEIGTKIPTVEAVMRRQREITAEHEAMREQIMAESRPEAADLEMPKGGELSREQKTKILRLLLERGIMERQFVREGDVYSLECARGSDQIVSVLVLDDAGMPDYDWQIDERTIKDIEKIIAE
jgi:hypothetical protein